MLTVFSRIFVYLFIIYFAYRCRQRGLFEKKDSYKIGRIIINLTLPASLIASSSSLQLADGFFWLFSLSLAANIVMLSIGSWMGGKKRTPFKAASMLTLSTYNIGNFILPFVQAILGNAGMIWLYMFDSANAIIGLGVNPALARTASGMDQKAGLREFFSALFHSVPFLTYLFLFSMLLLHLQLPAWITDSISLIGNANGFLSMFFIGLILDFDLDRQQIRDIIRWSAVRLAGNFVFILIAWLLLPVPFLAKLVATLCLCAPVASASPVFAESCGYDGTLVSMVASVTMAISVVVLTCLLLGCSAFGLI